MNYLHIPRLGAVPDLQQGFGVIRVILLGCLDHHGSHIPQLVQNYVRTAIQIPRNEIGHVLLVFAAQQI